MTHKENQMRKMLACMAVLFCGMELLPNALAEEKNSNQSVSDAQNNFDAAYSICQAVAPVGGNDFPVANMLHPHGAATVYSQAHGITLDSNAPSKITLFEGARHGELMPDAKFPNQVFVYNPDKGYLGSDRMIFKIEAKGKILKVIYSVHVTPAPDYGTPECPDGFSIKELPNSKNLESNQPSPKTTQK